MPGAVESVESQLQDSGVPPPRIGGVCSTRVSSSFEDREA
jgi:hypothetical protein